MRKGKDYLIPSEKTKKVIYLERRGRMRGGIPVGTVFFGILGVLSILYCIGIGIAGFGTYFFLIWGVIGILCTLLSVFLADKERVSRLPVWLKVVAAALFCLGLILFGTVEGMILSKYHAKPTQRADYVIILGAQWKPEGPSEVLRRRLEKAVEYLGENPEATVIVSGGQGGNESISEAAGMRQYLVNAGINDERILVEDQSVNTLQNLVFSGRLLDKENDSVVIVTNDFHMYRALQIAKKQGYAHAEGLAASSVPGFAPNNLLREFLGVMKDFALGNL